MRVTCPGLTTTTTRAAVITLVLLAACGGRARDDAPTAPAAPSQATADSIAARGDSSGGGGAGGASQPRPIVAATPAVWAAATATDLALRLDAIGYQGGATLLGSLDETSITLPVNSGLAPSTLDLALIPTPGMPTGTLMLKQRDRILAQRALSDTTTALSFPLDAVVAVEGRATVTLALTIPGRDVCEAQRVYRTVVAPSSTIRYRGAPATTTTISGFFEPWLESVTFYLDAQPSLDAAQAALDASAFVARRYRGMSTRFEIKPMPAAGTPIPEPGPFARAVLWSPSGATEIIRPDSGRGTVLAVSARRDARQLFTLADGDGVVAANGFGGTTVSLDRNAPVGGAGSVALADLGFASRTLEGSALLVGSYPFALADLGGSTAPTAFRLVARHSVLPPGGNGSLRIHLNGAIIHSRALDRSSLDVVVPIPAYLLRRDNLLEVRFQVVLGEGACLLGGAVFTATVDEASAFLTERGTPIAPGFSRFPSSFVPAFSVLLEPRDRFRVELAAKAIGAMQQTTRTPLAPAVARDAAEAVGPLLAIGTTGLAEALDAPIHSTGFRLRDRDGRVWDEFTPDAPYATMQGWTAAQGREILLLHHTGDDGLPLLQLLDETLAPYGWFGTRGDVVIRGVQGPTRSLTLANAGWRIERLPDAPSSWLERYRGALILLAGVLVIGLLTWLYPRVVRRELDTAG